MKRETLRSVLPFVKEYAAGYGIHPAQTINRSGGVEGNALGAVVSKSKGIVHQPWNSTYCHAKLNSGLGVSDAEAILIQLKPCPDDLEPEAYRHYIQWVLNYSPWRHIFVSKSVDKVLKTKVVVIDPTSRKNTLIDGIIALRQAWDNYYDQPRYRNIGLWWELIQKADPIYSFAITSNLIYPHYDDVAKGIIHEGHSPIGQNGDYNRSVDNFVRGEMVDGSSPWNISPNGSAWSVWMKSGTPEKLAGLVSEALAGIGKDKAKVNLFKVTDSSYLFNRKEAVECLISEIPNMEKEIGKA